MNEQSSIDEKEIRKALSVFKDGGKLVEVRILAGSKTISGYFTSADKVIEELRRMDEQGKLNRTNVFYTINRLKDECYDRAQHDEFVMIKDKLPTTSDNDVIAYEWLLIDLDPERASGTSSTDEQVAMAEDRARKVFSYLRGRGFPDPVMAYSGNGVHLQYSVGLNNTQGREDLIKKTLEALSILFSDDAVKVDTSVHNPARICKLYGTRAQKGANTEKRPHRMSRIKYVPSHIEQVSAVLLQSLVDDVLPKAQKPEQYNNFNPGKFDLEEWLDRHGIEYTKKSAGDYDKFVLACCPFDNSHKAPDAMVTRSRAGELGFKCLHNSCAGKHWRDFRMFYEPSAYDQTYDSHIEDGYEHHKQNRDIATPLDQIGDFAGQVDASRYDSPRYLTATEISKIPQDTEEFITTGITAIDKKMRGLIRGGVTLLSGLRGGSKSTVLTQIALHAIECNLNVLFHSFELPAKTTLRWFDQMAAGKWNTQPTQWENYFTVKKGALDLIHPWLDQHLFIYDNNHGNDFEAIYQGMVAEIGLHKPDLIILDNLMALDISGYNQRDQYQAQTTFINKVVTLAKWSNTHIIVVAHPRKANGFLRLDDVSGTGNLVNAVNNAFIIHRVNEDFKRLTQEMFKWKLSDPVYDGTNVIEVAKDREYGTQDFFVPLYYERETRRLLNDKAECIHYGWETEEFSQDEEWTTLEGDQLTQMEVLWSE